MGVLAALSGRCAVVILRSLPFLFSVVGQCPVEVEVYEGGEEEQRGGDKSFRRGGKGPGSGSPEICVY